MHVVQICLTSSECSLYLNKFLNRSVSAGRTVLPFSRAWMFEISVPGPLWVPGKAVSYTHLDVYKRQVWAFMSVREPVFC